jgi:hypothetical protein
LQALAVQPAPTDTSPLARWFDESDDANVALALGLECSDCGRFSGPVPRAWRTCPMPESSDGDETGAPVLFFCPACASRVLD